MSDAEVAPAASREPNWEWYRSFLQVLDTGSLSAAGRAMGLAQPTVGRHVESLEAALGLTLFTRSVDGYAPTDAARELQPHAAAIAASAAALRRAASERPWRRRARHGADHRQRGGERRGAAADAGRAARGASCAAHRADAVEPRRRPAAPRGRRRRAHVPAGAGRAAGAPRRQHRDRPACAPGLPRAARHAAHDGRAVAPHADRLRSRDGLRAFPEPPHRAAHARGFRARCAPTAISRNWRRSAPASASACARWRWARAIPSWCACCRARSR